MLGNVSLGSIFCLVSLACAFQGLFDVFQGMVYSSNFQFGFSFYF